MAMLRRVRIPANRKPPKSAKKLARAVRTSGIAKSLLYRSKASWNVKSLSWSNTRRTVKPPRMMEK